MKRDGELDKNKTSTCILSLNSGDPTGLLRLPVRGVIDREGDLGLERD